MSTRWTRRPRMPPRCRPSLAGSRSGWRTPPRVRTRCSSRGARMPVLSATTGLWLRRRRRAGPPGSTRRSLPWAATRGASGQHGWPTSRTTGGRAGTPSAPRAFIAAEVWRRHVPGQGERVVEQRRAGHAVGGGEAPEPKPLPDTPAGRAWGQVLEVMRAEGRDYAVRYLATLTPTGIVDEVLVVECADRFMREW